MNLPSRVSLLIAALLLRPSGLHAAAGTEAAAFLDIPVGAGPAAMGSAYTALANDAYASVYNPAGLGFLPETQVAAQHLSYLESISYEYASAAFLLKEGHAIEASAQYLGSGNIPGADLYGNALGSYSSYYGSYNLAYGQALGEKLSLGITGKVINATISNVSATAYAADAGALYKVNDRLNLAATVQNLGTQLKFINDDNTLPVEGHLAVAYEPDHHFLLSLEGVFPRSGPAGAHMGVEWRPLEMIAIRAGYRTDTTTGLSPIAGMSAGLGLKLWGQEFAYAWVPYGDLGDTQYFSLLLRFGGNETEKKNMIHAEDIKRHRAVDSEKEDPETQQFMQLLNSGDEHTAQKPDSPGQELAR